MTPGVTSWIDARNFLASFATYIEGFDTQDKTIYSVEFEVPEQVLHGSIVTHDYTVAEGVIQLIKADTGNTPTYKLPQLLKTFGRPSDIFLRTFPYEREGSAPFFLVVFYPAQGIAAMYVEEGHLTGSHIRGCLKLGPVLWLWAPSRRLSIEDISPLGIPTGDTDPLRPLEEVTDMNVEEFYQAFQGTSATVCLKTRAAIWPP